MLFPPLREQLDDQVNSRHELADAGDQRDHEIATLAAVGLTNKQIGERLYLSHRTGAHLYRVFPNLGVTSRAALRDALASEPAEQPDEDHARANPSAM